MIMHYALRAFACEVRCMGTGIIITRYKLRELYARLSAWWWHFPRLRGFGENVRPFIEMEISSLILIPTRHARISPQWLKEQRRLWPNVPRQVACELVSR